jgi:hypothetical protein
MVTGIVTGMLNAMVIGVFTDMGTQISFDCGIQDSGSTIGIDIQCQIFVYFFKMFARV